MIGHSERHAMPNPDDPSFFEEIRDIVGSADLEGALNKLQSLFENRRAAPGLVDELHGCRGKLTKLEHDHRKGLVDDRDFSRERNVIAEQILALVRDFEALVDPFAQQKAHKQTTQEESSEITMEDDRAMLDALQRFCGKRITVEDLVHHLVTRFPIPAKYRQIDGFPDLFRDAMWRVIKGQLDREELIETLSMKMAPNEAKQLVIKACFFLRNV